jgi:hypothetical protein
MGKLWSPILKKINVKGQNKKNHIKSFKIKMAIKRMRVKIKIKIKIN